MCWPCVWQQKHAISIFYLFSYNISINRTEVDHQSNSLHDGTVKPKNFKGDFEIFFVKAVQKLNAKFSTRVLYSCIKNINLASFSFSNFSNQYSILGVYHFIVWCNHQHDVIYHTTCNIAFNISSENVETYTCKECCYISVRNWCDNYGNNGINRESSLAL